MALSYSQHLTGNGQLLAPRLCQIVFVLLGFMGLITGLPWPFLWLFLPLLLISQIILLAAVKEDSAAAAILRNSPWRMLRAGDGYLYIGERALPLSSVTEAVLDCQTTYVALHLPHNNMDNRFPAIKFNPDYLPAIKAFIRLRMPDTRLRVLHHEKP